MIKTAGKILIGLATIMGATGIIAMLIGEDESVGNYNGYDYDDDYDDYDYDYDDYDDYDDEYYYMWNDIGDIIY